MNRYKGMLALLKFWPHHTEADSNQPEPSLDEDVRFAAQAAIGGRCSPARRYYLRATGVRTPS